MSEGLGMLRSSRKPVKPMAIRDFYETGFDEDVQANSNGNHCPECDGRVTTNAIETICEGCGLVIDEQRIDHVVEQREFVERCASRVNNRLDQNYPFLCSCEGSGKRSWV